MRSNNPGHIALLIITLVFLLPHTEGLHGQSSLGLKAGTTFNFLGPTFEENYLDRVGYTFGMAGHIEVVPDFYINPELNYTRKAFEFYTPVFLDDRLSQTDVILRLNYLDIPINMGYGVSMEGEDSPDMFLFLYGGFQFNYLMGQSNKFEARNQGGSEITDLDEFAEIRESDIGINMGVGLGFNNIYLDARYYFGFIPLFEPNKEGDSQSTVTLSVAYRFVFK